MTNNRVIGKDNEMPWHLSDDLKNFKKLTLGKTVIMGRLTYDSIGKPLPNRRSIIITRNTSYKKEGCDVVHSLEDAIKLIKDQDNAFIIGGAQIYHEAIEKNLVDQLDITEVHQDFNADVYFPSIDKATWEEVSRVSFTPDEKNRYNYSFLSYKKLI